MQGNAVNDWLSSQDWSGSLLSHPWLLFYMRMSRSSCFSALDFPLTYTIIRTRWDLVEILLNSQGCSYGMIGCRLAVHTNVATFSVIPIEADVTIESATCA